MTLGAYNARHPVRQCYGAEVAHVIKNDHPADFIGTRAYVALHVREEHVDGEAVGYFDGGDHAHGKEHGHAATVRHGRQNAAEEPLLFEFPGFWGTTT